MKKSILSILLIVICYNSFAQAGKAGVAKQASPLKTLTDSASYAIGMSVANFYKQQHITKVNTTIISKAINDVLNNSKPQLDEATAKSVMDSYMAKMSLVKSKAQVDACSNFLTQNKTKPGVITTASGLQYEVLTQGTGLMPTSADSVTCNYKGTFLDGKVFDNSYDRGQPVTFNLGNVIPAWTEGLQLMHVGSKYKFYVPYNLGYGANDYGPIPGGSLLIFEVELLDVKKK